MPRAPRGAGLPRRPRAEATTPRDSAGSRSPEMLARTVRARRTVLAGVSGERDPAESRGVVASVLGRGGNLDPRGARGISTSP